MERLLSLVPEGAVPPDRIDVAVVALGPEGARAAAGVARRLRRAGISVLAPLRERPLGAQMKRADRSRARFALFVGRDEVATGRFGLKDLSSGEQVEVSLDDLIARVGEAP
jgi:histidyl-tRNA synthetase